MLGGTSPLTTVLGSAPTGDMIETTRYRNYAKQLAAHGLHILLIAPGSKIPVDMRSSVQKRTDDTAAQTIAREAGRPDWAKVKAKCGVHLATDDPKLLTRYIDNYRKTYGQTPINMAVAVGPSRLVIVDCDTEEQVAAFLSDSGIPAETPLPPTVRSPGQKDADGNWAHYGGGHYWFTLPEGIELPEGSGSVTMPGGYAILWGGRYVLIPPSIRPEGAYGVAGQDYPAPEWILDRIVKHAAGRTDRRQEFGSELGELSENIDAWSQLVSWEDLLEPAGWTLSARPDGCGCPVWTAPGVHASPKSATAHDTGCTFGRYSDVNAPLHIWTDNPGPELEAWCAEHGSKTVTKLQLAAVLSYGGNVGTACAELGVIPRDDLGLDTNEVVRELGISTSNLDEPVSFDPPTTTDGAPFVPDNPNVRPSLDSLKSPAVDEALSRAREAALSVSGQPVPEQNQTVESETDTTGLFGAVAETVKAQDPLSYVAQEQTDNPFVLPDADPSQDNPPQFTDEGGEFEDGVLEIGDRFMPRIALLDYWWDYPAPEFVVDGWIENGGMAAVIGPSGVGKTTVVIDILGAIATGQHWHGCKTMKQRVLYMPGEGMSGSIQRMKAWAKAHKVHTGTEIAVAEGILKAGAPADSWAKLVQMILDNRIGMLVFDTFARMAVGVEENSADAIGKVVERLDQVRKITGVTVLLLHHTARGSEHGRGSTALNGALDSEILVTPGWTNDKGAPVEPEVPGEPVTVRASKQKNAGTAPSQSLLMVPWEDSVVMTGPSGEVGNVFDEIAVTRAVLQEPTVETAVRMAKVLTDFTQQGLTVAEAAVAVQMDEWTARLASADTMWKLALRKAIDMGLRIGLFETLSGKPTGARYIRGDTGIEAFRAAAIAEGLSSTD